MIQVVVPMAGESNRFISQGFIPKPFLPLIDGKSIIEVIEDHIKFLAKESNLEINFEVTPFKMWSLYPFITRDIAVWVQNDEDKEKLLDTLMEHTTKILIDDVPDIFFQYRKHNIN